VGVAVGFLLGLSVHTKHDIMRLIYIEAIMSGALFFATILYFPNRPPTPPSPSVDDNKKHQFTQAHRHSSNNDATHKEEQKQQMPQMSFKDSLKELLTNPQYLILVIVGM
jgi:hypothetical protein